MDKKRITRHLSYWDLEYGGYSKTTFAEEVFNKLRYEYEGCYFLANEREESKKHGIISLKEKIFLALLGYDVKNCTENSLPEDIVRRIIGCMKVLIVIDDINDLDHLEKLLGTLDNFGLGSLIIVTTRDEQVLKANKVDKTYRLTDLSSDKAFELFDMNAFNQGDREKEYNELSQRVVDYAQGIPLIVKVLARLLHGKNKEEWESMLDKLKKVPPTKVYEVMKLSYDGLDLKEQQIFLDLACFFVRTDWPLYVGDLKSLLKDNENDNSVAFELGRLKDKGLITISKDNIVSIHDSLQEIACEIVHQESIEDPGSHSRLWDLDDVYEALKNGKGIEAIRSIQIQGGYFKKQKCSPHVFANTSILQFLEITYGCHDDDLSHPLYILAEGLQFLATELRFLFLFEYPLRSLPENFSAEKLVILILIWSKMEKLWDGVKNLANLKQVHLSFSENLKELPNLSNATNLEVLNLWCCFKLTRVHPSIFSLPKLENLDLCRCNSLTILPSDSHLRSLSYLSLSYCTNLRNFSLISENLKVLLLRETKVKALPSSINNLTQLLHLDVSLCSNLQTIPELLPSLETLNANKCISLKTVFFPSTTIEQLKENRKQVVFRNCLNLDEHTLVAIGLNAEINVVKFPHHHLSTPNDHHVENYNHFHYNNHLSYLQSYEAEAVYEYPGSSVPKWLEYKTTNYYIIIDLSSAPPSPRLAFIFYFVIGKYQHPAVTKFERFEVDITINNVEGEGKKKCFTMYMNSWIQTIESDHVSVMYDQRCSAFLNCRAKNQTRFKIHVTVGARTYKGTYLAVQQEALKGFGVSPISTSAYTSFIKKMELHDSMYQFH